MSFDLKKLVQPECGGSNPLVTAAHQIAMRAGPMNHIQMNNDFSKEFMQQANNLNQKQEVPSLGIPISAMVPKPCTSMGYPQAVPSHMVPLSSGRTASDFLTQQESMGDMKNDGLLDNSSYSNLATSQLNYMMSNMMANRSDNRMLNTTMPTAGDQLETKYRNDIMTQTKTAGASSVEKSSDKTGNKTDDLKFWQTLSQKTGGIQTYDGEAEMLSGTQGAKKKSKQKEYDLEKKWLKYAESNPYVMEDNNEMIGKFEDPFSEGLKKLEMGDIPAAALLFEAAVKKEPKHKEAWRYLGTTQAQNEKDRQAIHALMECLKLNPDDQEARLAISVSLANECRYHDACYNLHEWLSRNEKYSKLGDLEKLKSFHGLSAQHGYPKELLKYIEAKFVEAARLMPKDPDADVQTSLGVIFNMQGDYTRAVDCFKAALSVCPTDSILWNRLGATLANGNKSYDAILAYRKALELAPGFLRSRYNLAISLIQVNTYGEAAKQLIQILNMQASSDRSKSDSKISHATGITSTAVWTTLRTLATMMNKPVWYEIITDRNLERVNKEIFATLDNSPQP